MESPGHSSSQLPPVIPIFPLPGALLLPRGRLPLNIFEPRYLAMTDAALRTTRVIGMIQPMGGNAKNPPLFPVGCLGRLTAWSETGDGRVLITLTGIARFRIESELETTTPYRQVKADYSDYLIDLDSQAGDETVDRPRLATCLKSYLKKRQLDADWSSIERAPAEVLVNSLAMICPFEVAEKQALLEAKTLCDRAQMLTALIEMSAPGGTASGGGTLQ